MMLEEVDNSNTVYITYLEPDGKHYQLWTGKIIDPKHPQCYYCGRFVKIRWDREYSGPCTFCDEWLPSYY